MNVRPVLQGPLFRFDPVAPLADSGDPAIRYWARREFLGERVGPVRGLWVSAPVLAIFRRQGPDGSWRYPSGHSQVRSSGGYDLLETYRVVCQLVEKFGVDREHPGLQAAAEFLLAAQASDGDIRGIYGAQYSPNYTAGILELLVKAGFANDVRTDRGFAWLSQIRQEDRGWAIPFRTRGRNIRQLGGPTVAPDTSKPSSHLVTGVVLRAFAAHPRFRRLAIARHAAELIASRLFEPDRYPDRSGPEYWTRFSFPFWYTDLISALDSLSRLGWRPSDPRVARALAWLADRQTSSGLFDLRLVRAEDKRLPEWLGLAICRVARRFGFATVSTTR